MRPLLLLLPACDPAPADADPAADGPTYYADVRPVLDRSCARCHTAGGIAYDFDDAANVQGMAAAIHAAVESGRMPPPAPDPECRDYQSSERFTLSDADRETLLAWAGGEAALGDPADAPGPRDRTLETLDYDLELRATQPYTPSFSTDENDYHCFLLDVGNPDTVYLTGMQALVDNPSIVHHVVLFQPRSTEDLPADAGAGFACSGLGAAGWDTLGAWGPGANPTVLPEGMGIPLEPNAQLILQMHYYDSFEGADRESDQSGYGLVLADDVEWTAANHAIGPTNFSIAADDGSATVRSTFGVDEDALVLAVWPHMHLLGSAIEQRVVHDDGSETCLLRQDAWEYHNQVTANFVEPVAVTPGDRIRINCTYDNSADNPNNPNSPPETVRFGEGTTDEMCFGFTLVATPKAEDAPSE